MGRASGCDRGRYELQRTQGPPRGRVSRPTEAKGASLPLPPWVGPGEARMPRGPCHGTPPACRVRARGRCRGVAGRLSPNGNAHPPPFQTPHCYAIVSTSQTLTTVFRCLFPPTRPLSITILGATGADRPAAGQIRRLDPSEENEPPASVPLCRGERSLQGRCRQGRATADGTAGMGWHAG